MTSRVSSRQVVEQEMYELFHDYWNLFTAIQSYIAVLRQSPQIKGPEHEAVEDVARLLARLQDSMEGIRARTLSRGR